MSIKDTILWWGALLLITGLLCMYGAQQFDKSPTVHPPTTSAVADR